MLKGDPQAGYGYPHFREMHLRGGAGFNSAGIFEMGTPFVMFGRNEDVAWTFMVGMGDNVDIYAETLFPQELSQFIFRAAGQHGKKGGDVQRGRRCSCHHDDLQDRTWAGYLSQSVRPECPSVTQVYTWKHSHWVIDATDDGSQSGFYAGEERRGHLRRVQECIYFDEHSL